MAIQLFEHNETAYKDIAIHPAGIGKSFIRFSLKILLKRLTAISLKILSFIHMQN